MMQMRFPFEMEISFFTRLTRDTAIYALRYRSFIFLFCSRLCASSSNCCWLLLLSSIQQLHQSGHFRNARAVMHFRKKSDKPRKLVRTRHRHSAFTQSKPSKQASRQGMNSLFRAWIEAKKFFYIIRILHSIFSAFKSLFNPFFP